jgi:hypothetical protein
MLSPLTIGLVTLNAKFVHVALSLRYLRNAARAAGFGNVWLREYTLQTPAWKMAAELAALRRDTSGQKRTIGGEGWISGELNIRMVAESRQSMPLVAHPHPRCRTIDRKKARIGYRGNRQREST